MWTEIKHNNRPYRWRWRQNTYEATAKRHGTVNGDWIEVEGFNQPLDQWRLVRNLSTIGAIAKTIRP